MNLYSAFLLEPSNALIETLKILTGKKDIDSSKFFTMASNEHGLRGHQLKSYSHVISTFIEFFPKQFSTTGTDFHRTLLRRPPSTHLRTDWITIWQILTSGKLTHCEVHRQQLG